jgi:heptosyltransferase-1
MHAVSGNIVLMTDILFIKTSSLGDVVHHMPAVTDVARMLPEARVTWLVEEAFAPLARLHPFVSEIIPVATRRWRRNALSLETWREAAALRAQLAETPFDVTIDTQGLMRSAMMARCAQGVRHGYDRHSIKETLAARLYDVTHQVSRSLHAIDRNRLLTAKALGYQPPTEIDYGLSRSAPPMTHEVVLFHGTSRAAKEWSEANWAALGDWLQRRGFDVLLPAGSATELARSERLSRLIPRSRVIDRAPLDHLAQIISGAAFVVGVDTGLLHLAAAYRTPLVAIFCATDPELTGPRGSGPIRIVGNRQGSPSLADVTAAAEHVLI